MRTLLSVLALFLVASCGTARPWKFASKHAVREALTSDDRTQISRILYHGQGERTVGDARLWSDDAETGTKRYGRVTINAYLFQVSFGVKGPEIEFVVNPEVGPLTNAVKLVQVYGFLIGQWPTEFLKSCESVVIHFGTPEGVAAFASRPNLVVHHGHLASSMQWGTIEETLLHEAAHLALDHYEFREAWKEAARADGKFITKYAMGRDEDDIVEDVAESFVYYYALRYRSKRLSGIVKGQIIDTIPNRIRFFDQFFGFSDGKSRLVKPRLVRS